MNKLITHNPYRLLGVFSNSPTKEKVANMGKMKAFLKVGKAVSFPLDLAGILPPIERTEELVSEADTKLALPAEQLKHAQFWFIKESPIDEVAFNNLMSGDIDKAIEIWSKKDNASSLQNRIVCALIKDDLAAVCDLAEKLYAQFTDSFVSTVAGDTVKIDNPEYDFIDNLSDAIGVNKVLAHVNNSEWRNHLSGKAISPLINTLKAAIETARANRVDGPVASYRAGIKLMNETKSTLQQLKKIASPHDLQYQMVVDQLANEILQCGIDYYNESDDNDAAYKAMTIQRYAQSIAVGSLAKERCEENTRILEEIIEKLPPKEILSEFNALMDLIKDFVEGKKEPEPEPDPNEDSNRAVLRILNAYHRSNPLYDHLMGPQLPDASDEINKLLEKARPYIIAIKEKVSVHESHVIEVCTILANVVLSKSIDSINKAQKILEHEAQKIKSSYSLPSEVTKYNTLLHKFSVILAHNWYVISELRLLPLSNEFVTSRLNPNEQALANISKGLPVSRPNVDKTLYYTDDEYYKNCSSYSSFATYIERYPNGRHTQDARNKMRSIEEREIKLCLSKKEYENFIKKYPNSVFRKTAEKSIEELEFKSCKSYQEFVYFVKSHPNSDHCSEAERKIKDIETKAYNACHSYNDYVGFIKDYPNSAWVPQAKSKRDQIRREIESKLRSSQTVQDCISLYRQYGSDPDQMIDKHAYSLCDGKSDLKQYIEVFSLYRKEAEETITKSNQRIAFAVIAIIIILIIIFFASQNS